MIENLLNLIIYIIVIGAIFGLLWWLVDYAGIPEPFHRVAKIAIAVIGVIIVIYLLLGLIGATPNLRLR
jgi:hypothetical protein